MPCTRPRNMLKPRNETRGRGKAVPDSSYSSTPPEPEDLLLTDGTIDGSGTESMTASDATTPSIRCYYVVRADESGRLVDVLRCSHLEATQPVATQPVAAPQISA